MIPSCWQVAPMLHGESQVTAQVLGIQGQEMVAQHFPTEGGKTKEASSVWDIWRVGWWTRLAFRPHPLLSWVCSPRAKDCSQFYCWAIHTNQKPAAQPCPNRRSPVERSGSSISQLILLVVLGKTRKREARPCGVSMIIWSQKRYLSPATLILIVRVR